MNMKKYAIIPIVLLLSSCDVDEMEQTIFVPDASDSHLPAYTEWGYNSFGARYERTYFLATNDIVPCKITVQDGIMTFSLSGRISASSSSHGTYEKMTLYFSFPVGEPMRNYWDLQALHQQTFDLTDPSCEVKMTRDSKTETIELLSGSLFFKRVQLLRINEIDDRAIVSGTFELAFLRHKLPEALTKGRFDLGITSLFYIP